MTAGVRGLQALLQAQLELAPVHQAGERAWLAW
jgi:hypothetical protein